MNTANTLESINESVLAHEQPTFSSIPESWKAPAEVWKEAFTPDSYLFKAREVHFEDHITSLRLVK